ncbi:ParA family protein [Metallosphaera tengchongensis]|uniref:ParA family protein n=1 Tax=Metallosphaera tengchongensis TaxID=1532350 RepID=A0A6N0NTM8_9CREN|nr:ParA family protein [Metallosphaera tengchongensis]QKR00052.1 ParA family protein [Metallosphaera tengchongensis]
MIKIGIFGIKDRVGKTTLSVNLAMELSNYGRTLIVDKTPTCGLWRKLGISGSDHDLICYNNMCVLKLFRKPFRINEEYPDDEINKLMHFYRSGWDYIVIDNFTNATLDNKIVRVDLDALPIFVTDPLNIDILLRYASNFPRRYALIVNFAFNGLNLSNEVNRLFQMVLSIPVTDDNQMRAYLGSIVKDLTNRSTLFYG